jgi:hypothetical protein
LSADHLTQAILKALAQHGFETDPTHVSLLGSVTASDADPLFEVRSVQPLGDGGTSSVKFSCLQPSFCLPFYALVRASSLMSAQSSSLTIEAATKLPVIMRTGARATLLMDDGRASLQIAVISLGNGALGHIIRVRTPDRKRTYSAEVLNANTLEARF